MSIDITQRTNLREELDNFSLQGRMLNDALDKIALINRWLGGNRLTLRGLKNLLLRSKTHKEVCIADVGCGNGDMLRIISRYAAKNNIKVKLIGIDANRHAIAYARALSHGYNIEYMCMDIFDSRFAGLKYDIALCTLTLHHFSDRDIITLIGLLYCNAAIGVVINDLHRSRIAYRLFRLVALLFNLNRLSKDDGLVSILRGFSREDLELYSKKLKPINDTIRWRWAFRYEWLIYKI